MESVVPDPEGTAAVVVATPVVAGVDVVCTLDVTVMVEGEYAR